MKKPKNPAFKMLPFTWRKAVMKNLKGIHLSVWLYHYWRTDQGNENVEVSLAELISELPYSLTHIKKARAWLVRHGWLTCATPTQKDAEGKYTVPIYIVSIPEPQNVTTVSEDTKGDYRGAKTGAQKGATEKVTSKKKVFGEESRVEANASLRRKESSESNLSSEEMEKDSKPTEELTGSTYTWEQKWEQFSPEIKQAYKRYGECLASEIGDQGWDPVDVLKVADILYSITGENVSDSPDKNTALLLKIYKGARWKAANQTVEGLAFRLASVPQGRGNTLQEQFEKAWRGRRRLESVPEPEPVKRIDLKNTQCDCGLPYLHMSECPPVMFGRRVYLHNGEPMGECLKCKWSVPAKWQKDWERHFSTCIPDKTSKFELEVEEI